MDVVEKSNTTLLSIEQNDPNLTHLAVVNRDYPTTASKGRFWVHNGADLSKLGAAIANNTHLEGISFYKSSEWTSQLDANALFEGLQRNTTIKHLCLVGGIGTFDMNNNLTDISVHNSDIRGGVAESLVPNAKKRSKLKHLFFFDCDFDDASIKDLCQRVRGLSCLEIIHLWNSRDGGSIGIESAVAIGNLLQDPSCGLIHLLLSRFQFNDECTQVIISSLIGNAKLEHLSLSHNSIGRSSCESIVNLLQSPSCNITHLNLGDCGFKNDLATIIVNSLIGNTKLVKLDLSSNGIGRSGCESIASLLQDFKSNINNIDLSFCRIDDDCALLLARSLIGNKKLTCLDLAYNSSITKSGWDAFSSILLDRSNQTLCSLARYNQNIPTNLVSLLKLNHAVDMEPLFELNADDDERNLKALPHVIDWFGRVRESTQDEEIVNRIDERKLSAIFQFARTMPLQFVPASHFMHPSVVSLIQVRDDRDSALESKYRALQRRNTELEKEIATKEAEISSMQDAKKKLEAKEEEIRDLNGRLDSIVNVARKRKFPWD